MSVKGFNAIKRKVGSIRAAIADGSLFEEAATEWVEQDFKPLAKQLVHVRSGELRDSIDGEVNPQQVRVFADAPHARYEEEGTSTREAHPYMRPAFEKTRRKLSERTRKAFRRRFK